MQNFTCMLTKIKSSLNLPEAQGILHNRFLMHSKIDRAKLLVHFWEDSVRT